MHYKFSHDIITNGLRTQVLWIHLILLTSPSTPSDLIQRCWKNRPVLTTLTTFGQQRKLQFDQGLCLWNFSLFWKNCIFVPHLVLFLNAFYIPDNCAFNWRRGFFTLIRIGGLSVGVLHIREQKDQKWLCSNMSSFLEKKVLRQNINILWIPVVFLFFWILTVTIISIILSG